MILFAHRLLQRLSLIGHATIVLLFFMACSMPLFAGAIDWPKEREFWSFQKPVRHHLPSVWLKSWPAEPIDFFVLAKLESAGLKPSHQASKRELVRRATFDLTGLPPTPEQVDAFLADTRADAYEQLVERL